MIKAIAIVMCTMVGLLAFAVLFFMLYSLFWMWTERMREILEEGEPGDLEIPWGEDYDR